MKYIDTWRSGLPSSFRLFGALFEQNRSIDTRYGVLAGSLLWAVRNDSASLQLKSVLIDISGATDVQQLLQVVQLLQRLEPLASAQFLSREARDNDSFRSQLNRLLEYFLDDLLQYQLLKPIEPDINVGGDVRGEVINIGGKIVVLGDLRISPLEMPLQYDDSVQKIKKHAEFETPILFEHMRVSSIHLLFSLCDTMTEFPMRRKLRDLVNVETLEKYIKEQTVYNDSFTSSTLHTSKGYEEIFEKASQIAREDRSSVISVQHLIRAISALQPSSISKYWHYQHINWTQFNELCAEVIRAAFMSPA